MAKYKNIIVIFTLFSIASCDKFWEVKRKVRLAIIGESVEDALEAEGDEGEAAEEESSPQASVRIDQITPQSKLFNLMREFNTSGDETFVPVIMKQIPLVAGEFSGPYNETLVSALQKFAPRIENRNANAVKIVSQWYKSLNGKNKKEAGKVLALNFDYNVKNFFEKYKILIQNDGCKLSLLLPTKIQGNFKSIEYLSARREKLQKLMDENLLEGFSATVANQCISMMKERINLFKSSKTDLN